jgi:NADPH2 dehydrogenase
MAGMPALFEPLRLGGIALANRIAVSPMCQYSSENGAANDWHLQHLGSLSLSAKLPWEGGRPLAPGAGAWTTAAPSGIPFDIHWPVPEALDGTGLSRIRDARAAAARRAQRLGLDLVELLGAHGFLLHSFLSPISNRRSDSYGGSLHNRMRYPLEVAGAIREVWPRHKALVMRITGTDWADGGITPDEAGIFAGKLHNTGFDYVCVSYGGINPAAQSAIAPGDQVPFAAAVKKASGMVVKQSA